MLKEGPMDKQVVAADANEMIRLADSAELGRPLTNSTAGLDVHDAYRISAEVLRRRESGGWLRLGRKIGFTNRAILEQYGVFEPIFGYMYDRTVISSPSVEATLSLDGLVQPLIEPEIALKLRSAPSRAKDPAALLSCIDWIAHGFEIVQCHFPDWKFKAADTIADGGLHGRYIVGPPLDVSKLDQAELVRQLETFQIELSKNGRAVAQGGGDFVLGSPLNALAHLASVLEGLPDHPALMAGELITTGTLTPALPIARGELWSTRIEGLPVRNLHLRLE
jgi:2-oxo-3-hexenedioate decarboxylase